MCETGSTEFESRVLPCLRSCERESISLEQSFGEPTGDCGIGGSDAANGYPMPPLNPGGNPPISYDGPVDAMGNLKGGTIDNEGHFHCDCEFSLPDGVDPCANPNP